MKTNEVTGPGYDSEIVKCLESWGIGSVTEIQKLAIESGISNGTSMLISSPTSSGKTLIGVDFP